MKFLYCDSCVLISFFQSGKLEFLSQYKECFFISNSQIRGELIKPRELAPMVRKAVTVIMEDRDEIIEKAMEFNDLYSGLSIYDCLCMAYSLLDGYCLITDDKALRTKCIKYGIDLKTSAEIEAEFNLGGKKYESTIKSK